MFKPPPDKQFRSTTSNNAPDVFDVPEVQQHVDRYLSILALLPKQRSPEATKQLQDEEVPKIIELIRILFEATTFAFDELDLEHDEELVSALGDAIVKTRDLITGHALSTWRNEQDV